MMIVHSIPYTNLKIAFFAIQIAVTWFGAKVAWVGHNLPGWFVKASVVHTALIGVSNVLAIAVMANALGDMGENFEGKGLWWDVRNPVARNLSNILVNYCGMALGVIIPLIQSLWLAILKVQPLMLTAADVGKKIEGRE